MDQCPEISYRGMVFLTCFAISAAVCLWLFWRQRNENYRLADALRSNVAQLRSCTQSLGILKARSALAVMDAQKISKESK